MIEYVILGTSHEIQDSSKFERPLVDAIGKHSIGLVAEEYPFDNASMTCGTTNRLHIPYLQVDLYPREWAVHKIDREMNVRISDPYLVDRRFRMGTGFAPMLIMPAANKKFFVPTSFDPRELEGFWNSLWFQAREAIAASDEVHIIGYSLPEYDNRARDLLLGTMRCETEVSICCRSATNDLVKLFRDSGFTNARTGADGTFEGWVKTSSGVSGAQIHSNLSAAL